MSGRALVLGGGGVTGIAWELGMLAGLADHGADLTGADLVVGTSAGSVVGVDVRSGVPLDELYERQLAPPTGEIAARMRPMLLARYGLAVAFTRDPERAGRRLGAVTRRARTEAEPARRKVIASRLPVDEWPAGALRITAVEVSSGAFVVFDASSGVSLVDAVGASCAVPGIWPPVTIDGLRYMDGGMRSAANVDLAAGYGHVVVLAPLTRGFGPIAGANSQVSQLAADGSAVVLIEPDATALQAIGRNVLDPGHRAAAARAGRAQAPAHAASVLSVWEAQVGP
jgi:NTE family protein